MDNSTAAKEALHEVSTMVHQDKEGLFVKMSKSCYKTIIEAIEKQIQKKPVDVKEYLYLKNGRCPNCHSNLGVDITPYCGECGQRIDRRV